MSEAVEILIKADDQASQQVKTAAVNLDASMKRVAQIFSSLESPADKLNAQLQELAQAQADELITAEQFAAGQAKITEKLKQYSDATSKAANQVSEAQTRAAQVLSSLETPAERYSKQLIELNILHRQGALNADELAQAQDRLRQKFEGTGGAVETAGAKTKLATVALQSVANLSGQGGLASLAGQIGEVAEKSELLTGSLKGGGAGALVMKAGLVALVAGVGAKIGTALGHWIFQTDKFERAMKRAADASAEFDTQIKSLQASLKSDRMEDIELIRDPEEKQAAYKKLFADITRDLETTSQQVAKSEREVEAWAEAWQITGDRKAYAKMAEEQLAIDKQRLATLRAELAETGKLVGEREKLNAQKREENAAKDKSESYIQSLRDELEILKATKDEQIEIEAIRNTVPANEDEAIRLLKERDAILAKIEAEEKLAQTQKDAAEAEKARRDAEEAAAQKEREAAEQDRRNIEELIGAEEDRLELQRIELEQGKEAAKAKALMNEGVDPATARRLAKEEAEIERLREAANDKEKESKKENKTAGPTQTLTATEGRLLTRGRAADAVDIWQNMADSLRQIRAAANSTEQATNASKENLAVIKQNTSNTVQMEAVA